MLVAGTKVSHLPPLPPFTSPPPPCHSPALVVPRGGGGWGTVTWSTQNFSLQLIVFLCG